MVVLVEFVFVSFLRRDDELVEKFTDCAQSMLNQTVREEVIEAVFGLENLTDVRHLIDLVTTTQSGSICGEG